MRHAACSELHIHIMLVCAESISNFIKVIFVLLDYFTLHLLPYMFCLPVMSSNYYYY